MKKGILFLLIMTVVWSCSAPKKVVKKEISLPLERILKKVEAQRRKIKTFQATGLLEIASKDFNGKANIELLIKRPDSLKISFYGPFGISVGEALITNKNYFYYDALHNTLYYGKGNKEVVQRIFKLAAAEKNLTDLLLGKKNLTDKIYTKPLRTTMTGNAFTLFYNEEKGKKESFSFTLPDYTLTKYELLSSNGGKIFEALYTNFESVDGFLIPKQITMSYLDNSKLNLKYRSIKVNQELEPLTLEVPQDAIRKEW